MHIGAFVDREQQRRLVQRAREEDRTVSAVIRRALRDYLATPQGSGVMNLDGVRAEAAELQRQAMSKEAAS